MAALFSWTLDQIESYCALGSNADRKAGLSNNSNSNNSSNNNNRSAGKMPAVPLTLLCSLLSTPCGSFHSLGSLITWLFVFYSSCCVKPFGLFFLKATMSQVNGTCHTPGRRTRSQDWTHWLSQKSAILPHNNNNEKQQKTTTTTTKK
ncbi:unnamed protein product [Polarella glacialis]|uniref:Uncharacterized protein n=1 Tax=Polarella glacialis TaxID=89957 RepID=A0A813FDU9_POLGL|nr:unnamed protein product [Polarella glacialis]